VDTSDMSGQLNTFLGAPKLRLAREPSITLQPWGRTRKLEGATRWCWAASQVSTTAQPRIAAPAPTSASAQPRPRTRSTCTAPPTSPVS